jgi:hypothetical protein
VTPPTLRKTLGLAQVSVAGIGVILGAGVYALIAPAAAHAGDALWLAFLLAGVTAGLTAYAYARLGSMQPKASPEFQYTTLAFGPRVGFFAGWLMLAADIFAAAAVAVGFGGYVAHLAGTPVAVNALGLLVLVGVVLYTGVRLSVTNAVVLTLLEAAGQFVDHRDVCAAADRMDGRLDCGRTHLLRVSRLRRARQLRGRDAHARPGPPPRPLHLDGGHHGDLHPRGRVGGGGGRSP